MMWYWYDCEGVQHLFDELVQLLNQPISWMYFQFCWRRLIGLEVLTLMETIARVILHNTGGEDMRALAMQRHIQKTN